MIFNELPTAFPWFDRIEKQARYKETGDKVCDYKLITPFDALLPFEFQRPQKLAPPAFWEIFEINSGTPVAAITSFSNLKAATLEGKDYFFYNGAQLTTNGIPIHLDFGFYYSKITFSDGSEFFSEMFHVPDNAFSVVDEMVTRFLRLEWYNTTDLKPFYFGSPGADGKPHFRNLVFLDSFVTASEPEVQEDGTKDGNDTLIPTFQKIAVPYRITDVVPDFLKLALVTMQLHDKIHLTTPGGTHSGFIRKVETSSQLEANGFLSMVDILFEQDLLIIKNGCGSSFVTGECNGAAPVLNFVSIGAGFIDLGGIADPGTWIDVYSSATLNGQYVLLAAAQPVTLFNNGTLRVTTPAGAPLDFIKVGSKSFNCDYGFSAYNSTGTCAAEVDAPNVEYGINIFTFNLPYRATWTNVGTPGGTFQIYFSVDNGQTWTIVPTGNQVNPTTFDYDLQLGNVNHLIRVVPFCGAVPGTGADGSYLIDDCTAATFNIAPGYELPNGLLNVPYDVYINVAGTTPYILNVVVKPSWMTIQLVGNNVRLFGTPGAAEVGTTEPVNFTITNCAGNGFAVFNKTVDVVAQPKIVEINNFGTPGGTRTEVFQVEPYVYPGNTFYVVLYGHQVSVIAGPGDDNVSIAAALAAAINATSESDWNSLGSAPAPGTPGFPPTATVSGAVFSVTLNYQNQMGAGAY